MDFRTQLAGELPPLGQPPLVPPPLAAGFSDEMEPKILRGHVSRETIPRSANSAVIAAFSGVNWRRIAVLRRQNCRLFGVFWRVDG